jgi:hypothetical protein
MAPPAIVAPSFDTADDEPSASPAAPSEAVNWNVSVPFDHPPAGRSNA